MTPSPIKILFFADSHLGFDLPMHPRTQRRRRGHDFFSNFQYLLNLALQEEVDLVVHGGDFFFRSKIPASIIEKAYQSLLPVANSGIPIYLVPGNHERSKLPFHLWLSHKNIHVFDRPRTFLQNVGGTILSLSGFPFARRIRKNFHALLDQTCCHDYSADVRLLCMHQAVEGAQVGPADFTFRADPDTIPGSKIPVCFSIVLSGHIHRGQSLSQDLDRRTLNAPVVYPGSIERTSFAERFEEKYYVILKIDHTPGNHNPVIEFHPLKSRPMIIIDIPTHGKMLTGLKHEIREHLSTLESDSIVRIKFTGEHAEEYRRSLSAAELRSLVPSSMNISMAYPWKNVGSHH
ncbi:exonuclease SbcCD subunit D [Chloroflexota bacterium]